jgi:Xaa-Pro dipeptidase
MTEGVGGSDAATELAAIRNERDAVPAIGAEEHARRIAAAQRRMEEVGIEALWLDGTTNLHWLTGFRHGQSERLLGAVLPRRGALTYIGPAFEVEKIKASITIPGEVRGWEEDDNPYDLLATTLRDLQVLRGAVAIDDHARFFVANEVKAALGDDFSLTRSFDVCAHLRARKSEHEIALIRHAMGLTLNIQARAARILREGISTAEVMAFIGAAHAAAGFDPGLRFGIVLFGTDSAYPHGVPKPKALAAGEVVLVDCGATMHGYASDITRSYVFGEPSARQRFLWDVVKESQAAAFAVARPGVPCSALDDAARAVIVKHGFGPGYATPGLPHRVGHGVGMDGHEEPYFVKGNSLALDVGMCGSIEPTLAVYGECGIRHEDHIFCTERGASWFTEPPHGVEEPFRGVLKH